MVLRVAALAVSILACAWFALGIRQTDELAHATAISLQPMAGGGAAARHAKSLLHDAGFLNPDRQVDVVRGRVLWKRGDAPGARRLLGRVVRDEPKDLNAWIELAAASTGEPRAFRAALAGARALVPVVRTR